MSETGAEMLLRYGRMHHDAGRLDDAIACYRSALAQQPDYAEAHHVLGDALATRDRLDEAIASYHAALALEPGRASTWNNLGTALRKQTRLDEAADCFRQAQALRPDIAAFHNNLASALLLLNRPEQAIASYRSALSLQPDYAEAHCNLGQLLAITGRYDEAIASFTRALELKPDHLTALSERAMQRLHVCDWREYDADRARLLTLARKGAAIVPFHLRAVGATAAEMLSTARRTAQAIRLPPGAAFSQPRRDPPGRLRLGYLSSDFRQHPVTLLSAELFERHDRARFELFAYSHGPDDGSDARQRLRRSVDHFADIRTRSDAAVARRIHDDAIDILVDLNGLTTGARPAILAHRPAPVQVSWLGYIGTTGADFIDYVIADPFAVPAAQQPYYAERIVHLPHCYLPLDTTRAIAGSPPRAALGLPEAGFVFCCFNNRYKITPAMFDAWMRILGRVPGSVLWLLGAGPSVAANLKREAAARGVASERLVLAPTVPLSDYLARFRRADLFLDTLPCSACTIGADTLWAGLPLLTCAGEVFAGRHAGSLLRAAGLPELVTHSLAEYEALAIRLATEPGLLEGLRLRLQRRRAPLFDIAAFTRDLEAIYRGMAEHYATGAPPAAFTPAA